MADSYERFLGSTDLAVWCECLHTCNRQLSAMDDADPAAAPLLARTLVISIYARWLAWESGSLAQRDERRALHHQLVARLCVMHRRVPGPATERAWGIVLAERGERHAALALLGQEAAEVAELVPLLLPPDHAQRAALLRPHLGASPQHAFGPIVVFYCHALIALGTLRQAEDALAAFGLARDDPFALELQGKIQESSGDWRAAAALYAGSAWPRHRHRAQMCAAIAGRAPAGGSMGAIAGFPGGHENFDRAMLEAVGHFEVEIDQIELARCTAFVNACLWNPVADWRVRLEQGKLAFRRRHHSEAAAQLLKALHDAPASVRSQIAELRWAALTWLDGSTAGAELHMQPEAIEAAYAIIDAGGSDPETAASRVWLAAATGDTSVLPAALDGWSEYLQARAQRLAGNEPEALAANLRCACENYFHRNVLDLIEAFHGGGFERSFDGLLQQVMQESWDDFSALLEAAQRVIVWRLDFGEGTQRFAELSQRLQALVVRLLELSQADFQHLIRAQELVANANAQDLAETLLRRAATLAEGCSEHLAVAVARRRSPWFDFARGDELALECLRRAEREARERLERAQIARELFHNGRAQRARQMLERDRLLADDEPVEPIEAIVVLQCWRWLGAEELKAQVKRCARAIERAQAAGVVLHGAERFRQRVRQTLGLQPEDDEFASEPGTPRVAEGIAPALAAGAFAQWRRRIDGAVARSDREAEIRIFTDAVSAFEAAGLEQHLALAAFVVQRLRTALVGAQRARPQLASAVTPICHNTTLDEDQRAVELADRWRALLTSRAGPEREHAGDRLAAFQREEDELRARWLAAKRAEAEPLLRTALHYARWLSDWAPILRRDIEQREPDLSLTSLYAWIAADADALAQRTAAQARMIEGELATAQPQAVAT